MTEPSARPARRRAFWAAVMAALVVTATGVVLAIVSESSAATGPAAVVTRYFSALRHGDAALALSLGRRPRGDAAFLTSTALREQQRVAPIADVVVRSAARRGNRATVRVSYSLGYPDGTRRQHVDARLVRRNRTWAMRRVAGATRLVVAPAGRRASVLGGAVPTRRVVLFPGAAPVSFDTPYLDVSGRSGVIGLRAGTTTVVRPVVSGPGRLAVTADLERLLRRCLTSGGAACPQPPGRVVPGSVRGRVIGPLRGLRARLVSSPVGILDVHAVTTVAIRFRRLTFRDQPVTDHARTTLSLHTSGYCTAPLRLVWRR